MEGHHTNSLPPCHTVVLGASSWGVHRHTRLRFNNANSLPPCLPACAVVLGVSSWGVHRYHDQHIAAGLPQPWYNVTFRPLVCPGKFLPCRHTFWVALGRSSVQLGRTVVRSTFCLQPGHWLPFTRECH